MNRGRDRPPSVPQSTSNLVLAVLVVSVAVLPLFYAVVAEGWRFADVIYDERLTHILIESFATGLVLLGAIRIRGRLDRKLATVLSRVLVIQGTLAFWILVTRSFHSNKVMLTAAITSAVLGVLVMLARHVSRPPKIAVLGPAHPLSDQLRGDVERIVHPRSDLSGFDVLLTTNVVDLSPEWAGPLAKAMLRGTQVRHLAEYVEESQGLVSLEHFDVEDLPASGLTSYRFRKRVMDVTLVALAAPVALPIVGLAMLGIWATMGRPVFFNQTRIGLGGRHFRMYKLRTMRPAAAGATERGTEAGDSRITPVGNVLRRFRIDELPQLLNVLKGEMSIIGPRPEWDVLSNQYCAEIPAYTYRSIVRPGITGWAQVRSGYATSPEEIRAKLTHDLFYIKNFSFALDVQILARTVWTLMHGGGVR